MDEVVNPQDNQVFIPVDLAVLRLDILKPFDIFIKISGKGGSYVLYSKKGINFTTDVKATLLENNVRTIYIPEYETDIYHQYIEDNLPSIIEDAKMPVEEKSAIIYDSGTYLMEKLLENPRADSVARTVKTVNNIVKGILSDGRLSKNLIKMTSHDYYTYTHCVNVGIFSVSFVKELVKGLSETELSDISLGFFLHDIGKVDIPLEILNKQGPLTPEEWNIMKRHPLIGCKILEDSGIIRRQTIQVVLQHHEKADGSGYPKGVLSDKINLYGKICSLADIFDAMTTNRPYHHAVSAYQALSEIRDRMIRKEFDRDFFSQFVNLFKS